MNKLMIIGNLTKEPVLRTTQAGKQVCNFTVAVNRHQKDQSGVADFFSISAWNQLAENCAKYLDKGRKVAVTGEVSVSTFQGNDGKTHAQMNVMASEVEFLSGRNDGESKSQQMIKQAEEVMTAPKAEYTQVPMTGDDLPF